MDSQPMKPNKKAFVFLPFLQSILPVIVFVLVVIVNVAFLNSIIPSIVLFGIFGIFIFGTGARIIQRLVAYSKESYTFEKDRIVGKAGGLVSVFETELLAKNITHVSMKLPFIESKLFGTGHIFIESAGGGKTEIHMKSIDNVREFYDSVRTYMQENGFSLKQDTVVQEERPHVLAAFFETIQVVGFGVFLFLIFGLNAFGEIYETLMDEGINALTWIIPLAIVFVVILVVGAGVYFVLKFKDLKQRVYTIYQDSITYSEGFLSKHYSFIPIENLTDVTLSQSLVDKFFGLYDIKVSCQGSSQEIKFKNMSNGETMKENIQDIIHGKSPLDAPVTASKSVSESKEDTVVQEATKQDTVQKSSEEHIEYDSSQTRELKMHKVKPYMVTLFLLPAFPIWVLIVIIQTIMIRYTTYRITKNGFEQSFSFITKSTVQYSADKITGVIIKESWIDRMFDTCSVSFWSIGASSALKFGNIPKSDDLYEIILSKVGIQNKEPIYTLPSSYSFMDMAKKDIFVIAFFLVIILVFSITALSTGYIIPSVVFLVVLLSVFVLNVVIQKAYYKRMYLEFYNKCVHARYGWLNYVDIYSLYRDIKGVTTKRYPFSKEGELQINIAGEQVYKDKNGTHAVSNSIKLSYIDDIAHQDDIIDEIILERPGKEALTRFIDNIASRKESPEKVYKPDYINDVSLMAVMIFLIPVIPFVIWNARMKSYAIEGKRLVYRWGIFYKKQQSILYNKIDHVSFSQGAFNKMFKNGTISVNTTGSSTVEMTIRNISEYKEFYEVLKKKI